MATLSPTGLAGRLKRLREEMERGEPPTGAKIDRSVPGLIRWTNAEKCTAYPSNNPNKIELLGDLSSVTKEVLGEAIARFRAEGVRRFFFWLDSVPESGRLAPILEESGLRRFTGTTYPVLTCEPAFVAIPRTDLSIRRLTIADTETISPCYRYDGHSERRFLETIGAAGFEHFGAFCDGRAVATARMFCHEGLAYLCDAGTLEEFRGRGGQSGLIAARINRAAELGCAACAVQTLAFLETSLNNLRRSGFTHSFKRSVYAYNEEAAAG